MKSVSVARCFCYVCSGDILSPNMKLLHFKVATKFPEAFSIGMIGVLSRLPKVSICSKSRIHFSSSNPTAKMLT